MIDVFISFADEDEAPARRLAEAVAAEGYSVGWDDSEEIGEAKAAIILWSDHGVASKRVRARANAALGEKTLVQASIGGRMPPMPFNQLHFASLGDWRGEADHQGWQQVKVSLVALCGPRGDHAG